MANSLYSPLFRFYELKMIAYSDPNTPRFRYTTWWMVGFIFQSKSVTSQTFPVYTAFTFFCANPHLSDQSEWPEDWPKKSVSFWRPDPNKIEFVLLSWWLGHVKVLLVFRWVTGDFNHGKFLGLESQIEKGHAEKRACVFFALNNGLNMTIMTEVPTTCSNYHWWNV